MPFCFNKFLAFYVKFVVNFIRNLLVSWCDGFSCYFHIHVYLICKCCTFYRQILKLCLIVWLPLYLRLTVSWSCLLFFEILIYLQGSINFFQMVPFLWLWEVSSTISSHRFLEYYPHFCSYKRKLSILFVWLLDRFHPLIVICNFFPMVLGCSFESNVTVVFPKLRRI